MRVLAVFARAALLCATVIATPAVVKAQGDDAKKKPLPPEEVSLHTGDEVTLVATFYPSREGRKAVPVVLLHSSKGARADFEPLALLLQRAGHAVLAPDLRGHGDSSGPAGRVGGLRPADYDQIVEPRGDMETLKKFLMARNNAGELNIDKLCLVGIELGAVVALNWAARDWSWPPLATGKQGQDVKALVLISPEWSFKGLRINEAVAHPDIRSDLAVMIVAGRENSRALKESRRLFAAFEKHHSADDDDAGLVLVTPATSLQGARLLADSKADLADTIAEFIADRVAARQLPWAERKSPLP